MSGQRTAAKWRKINDDALTLAGTLPDFPVFWRRLPGGPPWTYAWAKAFLDWYALDRTTTPQIDHRKIARRAGRYLDALRESDELQDALLSVKELAPTGRRFEAVSAWLATLPKPRRRRDPLAALPPDR